MAAAAPGPERARVYGYILGGELVGAGLGYLVSGNLGALGLWRVAFWWLILPGLAVAWVLWKVLPEPARGGASHSEFDDETICGARLARSSGRAGGGSDGKQRSAGQRAAQHAGAQPAQDLVLSRDARSMSIWQAVRYVLRIRTNVVLIVTSALGYWFFEAVRTLGLLFARAHYGLSQSTATFLVPALGIGALVGVIGSGHLSDWLARKGRLNARILMPMAAFALAVIVFAPAIWVTSLWLVVPPTPASRRRRSGLAWSRVDTRLAGCEASVDQLRCAGDAATRPTCHSLSPSRSQGASVRSCSTPR
jgi:hypothetical protein